MPDLFVELTPLGAALVIGSGVFLGNLAWAAGKIAVDAFFPQGSGKKPR